MGHPSLGKGSATAINIIAIRRTVGTSLINLKNLGE